MSMREDMFPLVRRAIDRAYSRRGAAVSRDAVVSELLAMPEVQAQLGEDALHDSRKPEWIALGFLLSFDQWLITGRLPHYEAEILRVTGPRGTWSYQLFPAAAQAATSRVVSLNAASCRPPVRRMSGSRVTPASAA